MRQYPAILKQDEDGRYLATFPDFPEALTDGEDLDEALAEARDCLEEAIAGRMNRNEEIPTPSLPKKTHSLISLTPEFVAKVGLYLAWKERHISKSALARLVGVQEKEVRRLLDPHYSSKLPSMERALNALGKTIVVDVKALPDRMAQ